MRVGYHASHEQFSPRDLLEYVRLAERAGFEAAMCSDHMFPWSERQGHSGFAWSWLGSALEATSLSFGVVNTPGYRYHPAVIAHAAATLAQMYPDRFWISVGSGEALNEHITGEVWPRKADRNERLLECATIMRRLWSGEMVTHRGHVQVVDAKLYSLPDRAPMIYGAALTEATAEWLGGWADGMITVAGTTLAELIAAFRRGGGEGKPVIAQGKLSYAASEDEALRGAMDQWSTNVFPSAVAADVVMPAAFEELAQSVTPEQIREHVHVSSDPAHFVAWIREVRDLGVDALYLHNVNLDQRGFIDVFSREVFAAL